METVLEIRASDLRDIKNEFRKEGYVIVRNFFSEDTIWKIYNNARAVFIAQFKRFRYHIRAEHVLSQSYDESMEDFKLNMIRLFNEHPDVFMNCGKIIQTGLPHLYRAAACKELMELVEHFGVKNPFMCTRPVLFFNHPKLAKSEEYYKSPLHQDWPSMEASMNSVVVWVPLVPVNKENGSVIIYPGSHKEGVLPFSTKGGFANVEYDGKSIQPDLEIGDIVIFSTLLVHKSGDILNDTIRWSCHFRYTDMDCPEFIDRGYPNPYIYKPITKQ
jgi:phytanoyl-CoA hydroxylase